MGFYLNKEINTKLDYEDIALIAVTMCEYQERYKDVADKKVLDKMKILVNRLGIEMSNHPKNK